MTEQRKPALREVSFLPPLKMVLAFFDRETRPRTLKPEDTRPVETRQHDVKRIIDRLNEEDGKNT
jgi:hypothetical protein